MADTKISALTDGGTIATGDVLPAVREGANVKVAFPTIGSGLQLSGGTLSASGGAQPSAKYLYLAGTSFTGAFDISGDTVVEQITVVQTDFSSMDLSGCTALVRAAVSNNGLNTGGLSLLDLEGLSALEYLDCSSCGLSSLDLSDCAALESLHCRDNNLTALDVSANTALTSLQCSNELTSLDLTGLTSLETFGCSEYETLETVTMPASHSIREFYAYGMALTETAVNAILVSLDGSGVEDGEVDLSNPDELGTNAAPTGAGATAVTSLQGKGWSVTVAE
jgi:hypothetical protein